MLHFFGNCFARAIYVIVATLICIDALVSTHLQQEEPREEEDEFRGEQLAELLDVENNEEQN